MSVSCDFCGGPCNPYDESTYKEVAGWVHGKKSDSMTLRAETGKFAHERCVLKAKAGVAPNDPELFPDLSGKEDGPEKVDTITFGPAVRDEPPTQQVDDELIEEIFEQVAPPPTIAGLGEMLGLEEGQDVIVIPCQYDGPDHIFPDDWEFGGANGQHPGADPRFCATVYVYYNDRAQPIWTTMVPLCDDQAIDNFTWVGKLGRNFNPVWLSAQRYQSDGSHKVEMLMWTYDKTTDTATEKMDG